MHFPLLAILIGCGMPIFTLATQRFSQVKCYEVDRHQPSINNFSDCLKLLMDMPGRTEVPPHIKVPALIQYNSCVLAITPIQLDLRTLSHPNTSSPESLFFFGKAKQVATMIVETCTRRMRDRWKLGAMVMGSLAGPVDREGLWRQKYIVSLRGAEDFKVKGFNHYELDRWSRVWERRQLWAAGTWT
jgi:hypothetical protein